MSHYQRLAGDLTGCLDLSLPPIAVSFCDHVPADVSSFDEVVAAGCVFWQKAATRTFATSTGDHSLCAIGVYTHNMAQPSQSFESELRESLQAMSGVDYVRQDEVAAIPVVQRKAKHVIYGPLAEFPIDPEIVLLFAHARQSLIISEAVARVDGAGPVARGRPACAAIPQVLNHGNAVLSLGCCGARAYLDALSDSIALWAFPAGKLDQYCEQIEVLAAANKTLTTFHRRRREDIASGQRPTVRQSLERLSS
jgi:uncharacterized protein (DUF169 family)